MISDKAFAAGIVCALLLGAWLMKAITMLPTEPKPLQFRVTYPHPRELPTPPPTPRIIWV